MGALAFQEQVENLAAVTRGRSLDMPKKGEVLTFKRASIVRVVNRLIDGTWSIRGRYISSLREVPSRSALLEEAAAGQDFSGSKQSLERLVASLQVPTMHDSDGRSVIAMLDEIAREWAKKSADDGRFVRRLAKRAREAGQACDTQRLRVLTVAIELLDTIEIIEATKIKAYKFSNKYQYDDIFDAHLSSYPVTMDYLAR
ncbi:hypothetical protein [Methylobacterium sp. J-068]|uniref:hypothetical protein n=1 Tax=Methylobacterium sp. J-068 TaxID=2836649 RepID=UPI001FBC027C|nr:hypothetical protein [Methylobacterium sp. J-068]MCJ2032801.1 hypothetical protein [Methylobacterium sp. J-068]